RHEASVAAVGEPLDLTLRLRGALSEENVWTGTVLELVNRGAIPVELAQPVEVTLGPALARARPFELRAVDGRVVVDALEYEHERLRTAGSFQALPVARLIELVDRRAPVKGSLRISGRWDVATSPELRGSLDVARDSGDLAVGTPSPFELGLSALTANAEIGPAAVEFRADVELALARATASGRIGAVAGGEPIPYSAASPLQFTASVDVARLAPLAAFIDTAMILRGEAHARLQGSGTLGDPQISGEVRAANVG